MNDCGQITGPKSSPLEDSLKRVDNLCSEIENIIDRLGVRTQPIRLSMPHSGGFADEEPEPPKAQVVEVVDLIGNRLHRYLNDLRHIIDEFQI